MYVVVAFEVRGIQPDACMFEGVRPTEEIRSKRDFVADLIPHTSELDAAERVDLVAGCHQPHARGWFSRQEDWVAHMPMMRDGYDRRPPLNPGEAERGSSGSR